MERARRRQGVGPARPRSASRAFLRASLYHSTASFGADAAGRPEAFATGWERHARCFDAFVECCEYPTERLVIPYEGTTLPGLVFRCDDDPRPRRTLVFNNGSDGPYPAAWVQGVAAALDRGWHAVVFDGPGQNAALVRQGLLFRADWEAVITPVVDHLLTVPGLDPDRLALLGVSQGGYWVPRAVAHEHRVAAAVADPGVHDVFTTMTSNGWDDDLAALLDAGDAAGFD